MKKNNEKQTKKTKWYANSVESAYKNVNTNENGLTTKESEERLLKYGENTLPQKKPKPFIFMLLKEFINPIVIILLVAMAFSFIVGELLDGFVILGIIFIDAIIGAIQEKRA